MLKKIALGLVVSAALLIALISYALQDNPARPAVGTAKVVDNGGIQIEYFISGDPDTSKETLVLQASYARSGSDFNELVAELNIHGYRTLIMQARGIDGSELPSLQTNLFDYAGDLAAVLDSEGLSQPVTLIGHAFGNRIARTFASNYPDRVRSLVLLAAGDSAPPAETRDAILKVLFNLWPQSTRAAALQQAFFAPQQQAPDYWMSGWYPKAGLAQGTATASTPTREWTHGGNAPMLIVQPQYDAAAAEGAAKLLANYPERVTVVKLANAGHAILPEQPAIVTQLIIDHLKQRP